MKKKFQIYEPAVDAIELKGIFDTADVKWQADNIGRGYLLVNGYFTKLPDGKYEMELILTPARVGMWAEDIRPFYKRWWSAIKLFWFRNSNPELWKE